MENYSQSWNSVDFFMFFFFTIEYDTEWSTSPYPVATMIHQQTTKWVKLGKLDIPTVTQLSLLTTAAHHDNEI